MNNNITSNEWFNSHFNYAASVIVNSLPSFVHQNNKKILDFGCGDGITALGVSTKSSARVIGVDITRAFSHILKIAKDRVGISCLPSNLEFRRIYPGEKLLGTLKVDAIYSWSVFEHIDSNLLDSIINDLYLILPDYGILFLQIEPLYYSPFGSHLGRYLIEPWSHLLLSHTELIDKIMKNNSNMPSKEQDLSCEFSNSSADHIEYIFSEYKKLNKLTADTFVDKFTNCGFSVLGQYRNKLDLTPPDKLLDQFNINDLITNELLVVFAKGLPQNLS